MFSSSPEHELLLFSQAFTAVTVTWKRGNGSIMLHCSNIATGFADFGITAGR
jgi:hypothetical protein